MGIRDAARQEAERQYPALNPSDVQLTYPREAIREIARKAFKRGAVWASEQADREPSDAEIEAATKAISRHWNDVHTNEALGRQRGLARAALLAAQEVRRG